MKYIFRKEHLFQSIFPLQVHKWITDSCNDIYDELVQKRETLAFEMLSLFSPLTAGFERISGPQSQAPIDSNSREAN